MPRSERILIAGGGIAGLCLATALRQRGFVAELVERAPRWQPVGGGIAVQPNAMRVLHGLGLGEAIEQAGAALQHWQLLDQEGGLLCEIDLAALWGGAGSFIGIERTKLHNVLSSRIGLHRLGTSVTSLSGNADQVSVRFNDGAIAAYDLVVGADGIHSTIRQFALGELQPAYGGQMVWRSLAPIDPPEPATVQMWLGDGCFFGLCPIGHGRTYGFGNVTGPRCHDPLEGRLERLRQRFAGFGRPVRDYLAAVARDEQVHCGPIEWLEADHWHSGRVILIGDAAHASSPMMAQGGSMAVEDAIVLAETLAATPDLETGLEAFVGRRRPRVEWVQRQSRAVGEMLRTSPETRNPILRERGQQAFYERFQPLTASP